jgi:hypothetical protein
MQDAVTSLIEQKKPPAPTGSFFRTVKDRFLDP